MTLPEGGFHVRVGGDSAPEYADGTADAPDAHLRTDMATCRALASGALALSEAVASGRAELTGPTEPTEPAGLRSGHSGSASVAAG